MLEEKVVQLINAVEAAAPYAFGELANAVRITHIADFVIASLILITMVVSTRKYISLRKADNLPEILEEPPVIVLLLIGYLLGALIILCTFLNPMEYLAVYNPKAYIILDAYQKIRD